MIYPYIRSIRICNPILLIIKVKVEYKYFLLYEQNQTEITLLPCKLKIFDIKKFKRNPTDKKFNIAFICEYQPYSLDEVETILTNINTAQSKMNLTGGTFKSKYLKYKEKYLTLKNKLKAL